MKLFTTTAAFFAAAAATTLGQVQQITAQNVSTVPQLAHVQQTNDRVQQLEPDTDWFESLTAQELWKHYRLARAEGNALKDSGKYDESIEKLLFAARCARKLQRPGIAAWQLNNAAKHSIDLFKRNTGYATIMDSINTMEPGTEKSAYMNDCRDLMKRHLDDLKAADEYLAEATLMNDVSPDQKRERVIQSNSAFVMFVKNFVTPES